MPNILDEIKEEARYADRRGDKGIVNEKTGSSILVRENGDVTLASSGVAGIQVTTAGYVTETSLESETKTVRKRIGADEIIINEHKLNPQLYELTDMKNVNNDTKQIIGNLTMMGTVLMKAWEPSLGKYVFIRRMVRVPIFSPTLDPANAHPNLSVSDDGMEFKK